MMYYTEITSVPIPRSDSRCSIAADLAARIREPGETVELRLHRDGGMTRCFIGTETEQLRHQLLLHLGTGSCGFRVMDQIPAAGSASRLFAREVRSRYLLNPGSAPVHAYLPTRLQTDPNRAGALFVALAAMPDGCGISFFFRRAGELPMDTATHLHRMLPAEGTLPYDLLAAADLYDAAGCVYGAGSGGELLASEICYAFRGLASRLIQPQPVGKQLLELARCDTLPGPMKLLSRVFLAEELEILSNLSPSAGIHGLPLNKDTLFGTPAPFSAVDGQVFRLGFRANGQPCDISLFQLRRGIGLFAAPGFGKGNCIFSLAKQLHSAGVPMLLIESAKQEQHHLRKIAPELRCWQPRSGEYVLNPFALPPGITVKEYRSSLLQMLRTCFKLDGPLEELFSDTLNRCFARYRYTDESTDQSPGVSPFGMSEFMEEYARLMDEDGYSRRTQQDIKTAGLTRLKTLFNQDRDVFDTVSSIPVSQLLAGENLLQLNCLPTTESKQLFASMLLLSIGATLRLRGTHCSDRPLKLVIIMDESHNLLQPALDSQGKHYPFAEDFGRMILELRSLGIGFVVADQSADNLPDAISNVCATKIFLGGSIYSGITTHRDYLHADDTALRHLYLMGPGEGCYSTDMMPAAQYFWTPNLIDHFGLDEDYPRRNSYLEANPRITQETFRECAVCPGKGRCSYTQKTDSRRVASVLMQDQAGELTRALALPDKSQRDGRVSAVLSHILTAIEQECTDEVRRCCTLLQFIREYNRTYPGAMNPEVTLNSARKFWAAANTK